MTDTKQPEALRLAKVNEFLAEQTKQDKKRSIMVRLFDDNAKELRRLHEVNAELLEALKVLGIAAQRMGHSSLTNPIYQAQAVIDKAEGSK
jgi:hypothetical protein